jgi:hypothetical protein
MRQGKDNKHANQHHKGAQNSPTTLAQFDQQNRIIEFDRKATSDEWWERISEFVRVSVK